MPMNAGASEGQRTYVPAAGYDWLLPLYDVVARLLGTEAAHRQLVDQADIEPTHHVLDPDPNALARARRKTEERGVAVRFDRGFSDELPYPEASFDRVLSAFMLHHLAPDAKKKTLREARRVLRSGSAFYALDFGETNGVIAHLYRHAHLADQHRKHSGSWAQRSHRRVKSTRSREGSSGASQVRPRWAELSF
jgi:ubiquinone/menaquinone biosynthesis C-methylase UbiE